MHQQKHAFCQDLRVARVNRGICFVPACQPPQRTFASVFADAVPSFVLMEPDPGLPTGCVAGFETSMLASLQQRRSLCEDMLSGEKGSIL